MLSARILKDDPIIMLITIIVITYVAVISLGLIYALAKGLVLTNELFYAFILPNSILTCGKSLLEIINYDVGLHVILVGYEVIVKGYLWELITSIFMHANMIHLLVNVIALAIVNYMVSATLNIRYSDVIKVFMLSGFLGNVATALLTPMVASVGASGALFGLLSYGAIREYRETNSYTLMVLLLIIFVISSLPIIGYPNILAHTVGLIVGIILGFKS